tara:strand:+ start:82 stop:237 length:156 start_codon:yes stop_codon:yes gene_type:complete
MGSFILLFLIVGSIYGIYTNWEDIQDGFDSYRFTGILSWIIVLSLIGHLFG